MSIEPGDVALLVMGGKKFLVTVKGGGTFHTHKGYIRYDDIIGKPWGTVAKTNMGSEVLVFKPTTADIMEKLGRRTQIIYPKDAGFIIIKSGILPGSRVLEAGSGSGSLTIALSRAVGPRGTVYSYEKEERFLKVARRNVDRFGLGNVIFHRGDVRHRVDERDVDAAFLDIPDPWNALKAVHEAMRPGAVLTIFVPSYEQIRRTCMTMKKSGFSDPEIHEILIRQIEYSEERTRPATRMVGHTGFVIFTRKILTDY